MFRSYADSQKAFVEKFGNLVNGVDSPEEFARILQDSGANGINPDGSKVPNFVKDTAATMKGLRPFIEKERNKYDQGAQ